MPIVTIELLEGRSQATKQRVASQITELLSQELKAEKEHIYVIFEEKAPHNWAVGGNFFPSATKPQGQPSTQEGTTDA